MMVRRLMEVDDVEDINNVNNSSILLSASDKVVLRELVEIFEQFEEVTKLVQGDKYVSLSLAIPCFIG